MIKRLLIRIFSFFGMILIVQSACLSQIDSSNVPIIVIDTQGIPIVDEPKVTGHMKIYYNAGGITSVNDTPNIYNGLIGVEIRGRYSASLPQKPYGLETRDSLGENLNVPLFHMPAENDWILLANYNDKTFMRNSLAFELFRQMGHYAPRTQFCEVIVNGTYQGIYVFTERIKRDKNRVDVATLNPDDNSGVELTGGYIFKIDYYDDFNSWPSTYPPLGQNSGSVHFVYHYPEADRITDQQKSYISQFVYQMETALYTAGSQGLLDIMSGYMDIPSFVDYFLLNELARNVDGYKKSSYFYKDKNNAGGLVHAGPVWDFDWAWKNINECYFGATDGSGWAFAVHQCDIWPVPPSWTVKLMKDVRFVRQVQERYLELRQGIFSNSYIFNYIDSVASLLEDAQVRHYQRWPILGQNVGAPEVDEQPATFEGEIQKFKNWISTRLTWLDEQFNSVLVTGLEDEDLYPPHNPGEVILSPNPAEDYLTLNGNKDLAYIALFSSEGKEYQVSLLPGSSTLDIRTLTPGLYLIKSVFTDGSQWTDSFIKE